ncbi:MAG: hypothetical protein IRZ28_02360 [Steroidobacteraceae bacterium]|jgi:hypothetical protein|nr:hypothetical protein [Steroidobacteraceae bacterium]
MAIQELTAVFESPALTREALERVRDQLGLADRHVRISAHCVLHVDVSGRDLDEVATALWSSHAIDVSYVERGGDTGWMGHHTERMTGACVAPGEGDGEAGTSFIRSRPE